MPLYFLDLRSTRLPSAGFSWALLHFLELRIRFLVLRAIISKRRDISLAPRLSPGLCIEPVVHRWIPSSAAVLFPVPRDYPASAPVSFLRWLTPPFGYSSDRFRALLAGLVCRRVLDSDSSSLAPEEPEPKCIVVLRVPKLPIATPPLKCPSSPAASRGHSSLASLRAAEFPNALDSSRLVVGGKDLVPAFGDRFLVMPYPGNWAPRADTIRVGDPVRTIESQEKTMAAALKSADTTRRFRLFISEGFLYPKSSVPTQDFPSALPEKMVPFRTQSTFLARLPPVDIPVWVDPVVDYDTGYGLSRLGSRCPNEFRLRWQVFESEMNDWCLRDQAFRARCVDEQASIAEDSEKRARDILAIRNSIQDVLLETRNAAIASAEYRVALRWEFDCAGTRAHAHQLYQELTCALQFLIENGDSSAFEDPYLDFMNTLLLQCLQSKDRVE
ncbi:hypothetical protein C8F01DRAFT_1242027 [Mycena amicta]|nr:hypothetical protein C8F01DRAFT_1242027 [Mycena amicta]